MTVISFVMLAIGTRACGLRDASTAPFDALTTKNARASGFGTAARALPPQTSATTTAMSSRRMPQEGYFTRSF